MDFSSLVLMEKDKNTKHLIKELGSYEVGEGALYITKFYCEEGTINVFFDTNKDVEEWEYSAIFDLFNEDVFNEKGYDIEQVDDEYNPTWRVKYKYLEEYEIMSAKVKKLCKLINNEIEDVFKRIVEKKELYK